MHKQILKIYTNICSNKNQAIHKLFALFQNISGSRKGWPPAYCLGLAESPTADFLLDWLKSSCSDPCRYVAVRTQPGRPAFMGGVSPVLYWLLVPARHAKIYAEIQIVGGRVHFHQFL
jgi:hypothetical protein